MNDQSTIPTETGFLGVRTIGVLAGVVTAAVIVTAYLMGANAPLWTVLSVCTGVVVLVTLVAVFSVTIVRRNRCWDRRCVDLKDVGTGPRWSVPLGQHWMSSGAAEWTKEALPSSELSHYDFYGATTSVNDASARPKAVEVSAGTAVSKCAGPCLTVIDGGLDERAAGARARAEGQRVRLGSLSATVVDRLFVRAGWAPPESFANRDSLIGYLGDPEAHHLAKIAKWVGSGSILTVAASADSVNWTEIASLLRRADVVFIDADFVGDVAETIDLCLRMRNYSRNSVLILISSEVTGHDLTAERSAICDATLKTPLTEHAIQAGVSAAYANSSTRLSVHSGLFHEAPGSPASRATTRPPPREREGERPPSPT